MDSTPRVTFAAGAGTPSIGPRRSPSPTQSTTPSLLLLQPHTPTPRGPNGRPTPPKLAVASTAHSREQPDGAGGRFVVHGTGQVDHDESDGGHQSTRRYARIVRRGAGLSSSRASSAAPTPRPSSRSSSAFDPRFDVASSPEAAGGGGRRVPPIALAPLSAIPHGYLSRSNLRSRSAGASSKLAYGGGAITPRSQLSSAARSRYSSASTAARTPRAFVFADGTARARQLGRSNHHHHHLSEAASSFRTACSIDDASSSSSSWRRWAAAELPLWVANVCVVGFVGISWWAYDVVDALVGARADLAEMTRRAVDAETIVAHVRTQLPAPPAPPAAALSSGGVGPSWIATAAEIAVWVCIAVAAVAATSTASKKRRPLRKARSVDTATAASSPSTPLEPVVDPATQPRVVSSSSAPPPDSRTDDECGGGSCDASPRAKKKLFGAVDGGDDEQPHSAGNDSVRLPLPQALETPSNRRPSGSYDELHSASTAAPRTPAAVPPLRTARAAVDDLLSHAPPEDGSPSRSVARLSPRVQAMIAARSSDTTSPGNRLDMAASP